MQMCTQNCGIGFYVFLFLFVVVIGSTSRMEMRLTTGDGKRRAKETTRRSVWLPRIRHFIHRTNECQNLKPRIVCRRQFHKKFFAKEQSECKMTTNEGECMVVVVRSDDELELKF